MATTRKTKRKPHVMTTEEIARQLLKRLMGFTGKEARDALVYAEDIRAKKERDARFSRAVRKLKRRSQ